MEVLKAVFWCAVIVFVLASTWKTLLPAILLSVTVAGAVVLILLGLSYTREWYRRMRIVAARADLRRPNLVWFQRPYCLLLRSTIADAYLSLDSRKGIFNIHDPSLSVDAAQKRGFRRELFEKMEPILVKAVKNRDRISDLVTVDYGQEWKNDIQIDFKVAQFILVVPLWYTESVVWELTTLRDSGLLSKCFLLMPPAIDGLTGYEFMLGRTRPILPREPDPDAPDAIRRHVELQRSSPLSMHNLEMEWERSSIMLRSLGFEVGRYSPEGGLLAQSSPNCYNHFVPWNSLTSKTVKALSHGSTGDSNLAGFS